MKAGKVSWPLRTLVALRNVFLAAYPVFRGCDACPDAVLPLRERLRGVPRKSFPVDVVYTWVDGADARWLSKRASFTGGDGAEGLSKTEGRDDPGAADAADTPGDPPKGGRRGETCPGSAPDKDSGGEWLFRDNGELRYSLRSLEAYAPWVRRIHVVTDGQTPPWLDTAHERIRMVDHRDIIPAEHLPTFNSHVIEAHLHRIGDLAEHFVYCNDDFLLIGPSRPEDFFTPNGLPYVFTDWRASRREGYARADTAHAASWGVTRRYMEARGTRPPNLVTAHAPHPQTRGNAAAAYAFFADAVRGFGRFRRKGDIAFHCHGVPMWAFAKGRAVPCDAPWFYINTKRPDRRRCYEALLRERGSGTSPLFMCLNDVGEEDSPWREDMGAFLSRYYPEASSFERAD